jgi:hypothetical protein
MSDIKIPDNLKPKDGRFGCGPSKIRPEALESLIGSQIFSELRIVKSQSRT